ncbi:pyrroline-5-carboxylate reductase [Betaproteobacteria bacterium]|nr:pyrroline-5-carboxylate reductase [Betaproteobacteria bacterium]GHU39860.1 pyrroline-5-carboxylate reductase [Betaproteobacteria bacterium]
MKITFLGGGNMAFALIGGLVDKGFPVADIQVIERLPEQRAKLAEKFGVTALAEADEDHEGALTAAVLVLAVKPQQMQEALQPFAGKLTHQIVLSIAAGLTLDILSGWLKGYRRIVRAMPNTPALIGAGMTGLCALPEVAPNERMLAERILQAAGEILWVDNERQMDAVTAISGSGPAYLFLFIEALQQAALDLRFTPEAARRLAIGTTLGAAQLAAASDESPAVLRERVTSKGGTTAAALQVMTETGVAAGIIAGAKAAKARSEEMARQLGNG